MRQCELEEEYTADVVIKRSEHVFTEMRDIKDWDKEVFVAFYLDTRNKIISREVVSIGTNNCSIIDVRGTYRTAISRNANALIICHNHPSGSTEPSPEDQEVTEKLARAGEILGIKLLDHVIVTRNGYYSFKDQGLM